MVLKTSKNGLLTYGQVELPDDRWAYSIVTEYKGPQDYGRLLFGFIDGYEPTEEQIDIMLELFSIKLKE